MLSHVNSASERLRGTMEGFTSLMLPTIDFSPPSCHFDRPGCLVLDVTSVSIYCYLHASLHKSQFNPHLAGGTCVRNRSHSRHTTAEHFFSTANLWPVSLALPPGG